MENIYEEIFRLIKEDGRGAIVTVIKVKGSSPQIVGAKMLVRENGTITGTVGGGIMEAKALENALQVIKSQIPETISIDLTGKSEDGPICGGMAELFIEPIKVMPRIVIFGAGHVGTSVSKIALICGFRVVVADDREEWANFDRLHGINELVVKPFEEVFDHVRLEPSDFVVIVTRGHAYDELCLEKSIKSPLTYLGMIGSKQKIAQIYKNLEQKGIEKNLLEKVHAPIGVEIAAITPAEIAISIMAEIIKIYRQNKVQSKTCQS